MDKMKREDAKVWDLMAIGHDNGSSALAPGAMPAHHTLAHARTLTELAGEFARQCKMVPKMVPWSSSN